MSIDNDGKYYFKRVYDGINTLSETDRKLFDDIESEILSLDMDIRANPRLNYIGKYTDDIFTICKIYSDSIKPVVKREVSKDVIKSITSTCMTACIDIIEKEFGYEHIKAC